MRTAQDDDEARWTFRVGDLTVNWFSFVKLFFAVLQVIHHDEENKYRFDGAQVMCPTSSLCVTYAMQAKSPPSSNCKKQMLRRNWITIFHCTEKFWRLDLAMKGTHKEVDGQCIMSLNMTEINLQSHRRKFSLLLMRKCGFQSFKSNKETHRFCLCNYDSTTANLGDTFLFVSIA